VIFDLDPPVEKWFRVPVPKDPLDLVLIFSVLGGIPNTCILPIFFFGVEIWDLKNGSRVPVPKDPFVPACSQLGGLFENSDASVSLNMCAEWLLSELSCIIVLYSPAYLDWKWRLGRPRLTCLKYHQERSLGISVCTEPFATVITDGKGLINNSYVLDLLWQGNRTNTVKHLFFAAS